MTNEQDVTLGEIFRMCQANNMQLAALTAEVRDRHHKMSNDVNAAVGPMATLRVQIANVESTLQRHEDDINGLTTKVEDAGTQAARVSGAAAVLAFVLGLIPWPWK